MRGSRVLGAVLGALALVFGVFLLAGCGGNGGEGDGQLTVEEFFLALEVLDDEYAATSAELEADFGPAMEAAASEEEQIEAFVSFTEDGTLALEEFIDGMAELSAPDELQEFQTGAVSTGRAAIDTLNDLTTRLSDVSTEEEFQAVFTEGHTEEAFDSLNAFCVEAQALADDAGVDVEFDCGEE